MMVFSNEQTFNGIRPIKYIFEPSSSKNKHLICLFSGFPKEGSGPKYQYMKTLSNIDCNKLFILDDHNKNHISGMTYYLGLNRDHSVENSVNALISKIIQENDLKKEDVILAGSSKGAWASLYFGMKYGYGHIIAGGPQTYLGMFLIDQHLNTDKQFIHEDIAGKNEDNREYLDNLLYDVTKNATYIPSINIHVGKGDRHYWKHVIPYLQLLDKRNIRYKFDLADYDSHAELTIYFPEFLLKTLNEILY